ncbi:MAG: FHA domain-containing protein [Gammaproteobacteria bacterium]
MSAVKHIVASLRGRSLKIRIGGINEVFASPDELAQFLGKRLAVPEERLEEFAHLDERALQREARKMLQAHQNVMDVMVSAKETGEPLGNLWRRLDISKVSDDHDWPSILFTLGNSVRVAEVYLREALSQYMCFLDARRDALDSFRPHRERGEGSDPSLTAAPHRSGVNEPRLTPDAMLEGYSRLPHCHAVEVDFEEKPDITVFLGTNRYRLARDGEDVVLKTSGASHAYPLKTGRNTVGRSSHCDVHLDSHDGDVSRQHLIVEINAGRRISLVDVSSRGTYVRPELLGSIRNDTATEQRS